jgi:hypothetical protein
MAKWPDRSLGLACFSIAQCNAIEDSLQRCGVLAAAEAFAPKGERLFIKNLESVQGDERDVIFISIGHGPDAQGRMTAGFGPLSSDGGERRLNVLISRARGFNARFFHRLLPATFQPIRSLAGRECYENFFTTQRPNTLPLVK